MGPDVERLIATVIADQAGIDINSSNVQFSVDFVRYNDGRLAHVKVEMRDDYTKRPEAEETQSR
jgi:hypothetical protein